MEKHTKMARMCNHRFSSILQHSCEEWWGSSGKSKVEISFVLQKPSPEVSEWWDSSGACLGADFVQVALTHQGNSGPGGFPGGRGWNPQGCWSRQGALPFDLIEDISFLFMQVTPAARTGYFELQNSYERGICWGFEEKDAPVVSILFRPQLCQDSLLLLTGNNFYSWHLKRLKQPENGSLPDIGWELVEWSPFPPG